MARLNVDADALAGRFQDHHGQDRPMVLPTTSARVLLHLIDGTVTSSTAATLRHAYCGPPLLAYIRRRNQWSEATTESVNWKAHGSALRRQIPRRRHFVKLVHDILPTNSQKNRMDQGKRTCPCCTSDHEDRDHILRCPSAARNQWRHKLLTTLNEACITHHTYEPLKNLLLEAVRQWLYPGQEPHPAPLENIMRLSCVPLLKLKHALAGDSCSMGGSVGTGQTFKLYTCIIFGTSYRPRITPVTNGRLPS